MEQDVKKKRKRPDRLLKLLARKNNQQRVIKCFLQSAICGQDQKKKIIDSIKERVYSFSQRQVIASLALNYIIKERFDNVPLDEFKNVDIPNITDTTFIRQLYLGTDDSNIPNYEAVQVYVNHSDLLYRLNSFQRYSGDRNIYTSGATRYVTNIKNYFTTCFMKRVKKFVYCEYIEACLKKNQIDKKIGAKCILYYLMNWKLDKDENDVLERVQGINDLATYILHQKEILGDYQIDEKWLKKSNNLANMVRYFAYISKFMEDVNKDKDGKQYNIVPFSKFKNHYISIDSSTLYGILKQLEMINCNYETYFEMRFDHWSSFIDIQKLQGKYDIFTGTIETDGIGLSVHFERPKYTKKKKEEKAGLQLLTCLL